MVEFDARETTVAPLRLRQGNDHGLRQRVRGLGGAFRAIRAREQAVITREQTCAQSSEVVRAPPRTRASAVAVTLAASMRSCRPVIRVDVGVDVAVGRVVVMVNVIVGGRCVIYPIARIYFCRGFLLGLLRGSYGGLKAVPVVPVGVRGDHSIRVLSVIYPKSGTPTPRT